MRFLLDENNFEVGMAYTRSAEKAKVGREPNSVGMVRALIQHTVHIQPQSTSEATPIPVDQVLALVDWYENHPERNHFGEYIVLKLFHIK